MGHRSIPSLFSPGDFRRHRPVGNCNPIELTLRHSFRKVEDFDYEPRHWDGIKFRAYGAFDVERRGYSRNYGLTMTNGGGLFRATTSGSAATITKTPLRCSPRGVLYP